MGAGGDFLAGLLSGGFQGIQEGAKIKLAKEDNQLKKKQIDSQERLTLAQQAETSRANQASEAIRSKQTDIEAELGRGNLGLGYAGLGSHEKIAGMEIGSQEKRQSRNELFQTLSQARELAARSGDKVLESSLRKQEMAFGQGLSDQSAEAGVNRNIRQAEGIARATLPVDKDLANYRSDLALKFAKATGEDLDGKMQLESNRALWDMAGALTGHQLATDQFSQQLLPKMQATIAESMAMSGRSGEDISKSLAAIKQAAKDINGTDQNRSLSAQKAFAPFLQAVAKDAPAQEKQAALRNFVGTYFSESQPAGGDGKIGLAAPRTPFDIAIDNAQAKGYSAWRAKGNGSDTAKASDAFEGDALKRVFNHSDLRAAAIKAFNSYYVVQDASPDIEDVDRWMVAALNKRPDLTGDLATRAAKLLQEQFPQVGRLVPAGATDNQRSLTKPKEEDNGLPPPGGVRTYKSGL